MSKDTVIPQAHSYAFFEKVVLAAQQKGMDQDALAKKFDVQRRTISYYVQLGRWIEFLGDDELTSKGTAFVDASKKERIALFKNAITGFDWVKNASNNGGTTEAFDDEIAKVSDLADTTRKRRARAMSKLWISVIEADGTKKKILKKKKAPKKAAKKSTEKKTDKKVAKKKPAKKTATKKKSTKKAEPKKTVAKKTAKKKVAKKAPKKPAQPKKAASKKSPSKKAASKAKPIPKKAAAKKEYKYEPPAANKAPDHPLVWVGKKVVKGAFKAAGKILRFL